MRQTGLLMQEIAAHEQTDRALQSANALPGKVTGDMETILRDRLQISDREAQVLAWIAQGKSNRDIAEILALSPRTVNKHLERIFRKICVENRTSAAVLALEYAKA